MGSIEIEEEMPESAKGHAEVEWAREVRVRGHHEFVNGWYASAQKGTPAFITLYARAIYRPIPAFLWWTTVPTLRIIGTLAHEVAHHLVATRGYVFENVEKIADEEGLANRFSAKVIETTLRRPSYRLGQWCIRDLAGWYYAFAQADWDHNDFRAAARRFHRAWDLCPDNEEAAYWYWQAKEKCGESSS
jgi:hypothetical protein